MKKLILTLAFIFFMIKAQAQDDQFYIGIYQMTKANAVSKSGDVKFNANKLIFKIDWISDESSWLTLDLSALPNIDWGGSVAPPETFHGALAEIDFGWYFNPNKPIKIVGSRTYMGLGIIGGYKYGGLGSIGITFPGLSFSALTKVNSKIVVNTKYQYSFYWNNTDSEYSARNTKLSFDATYKLTDKFGLTVSPNFNTYTTETGVNNLVKGTYKSVDFGFSLFW
ncbi:hypothetical protein [Pedobacter glucosidilyticus]|uniref:hypothetical protein n=1 Tax=Pedobacter glucosidilyticus TaxID=1122941 RepID=UPI0026F24899|nr:hypothetical protein [Pedobacter glucosidilyticus]